MKTAHLLTILRWDVDHLVFLSEYNSYYWLKPYFNSDRKRMGITSCCELNYECKRHAIIKSKIELQNIELN